MHLSSNLMGVILVIMRLNSCATSDFGATGGDKEELANGSLCRESCTHRPAGTLPTHKQNPANHVYVPTIQLKPIYWVIPPDGPTEDFVLSSQACGSPTGLLWPRSGVTPGPFLLPDTYFG
jgi:hypothetical protein